MYSVIWKPHTTSSIDQVVWYYYIIAEDVNCRCAKLQLVIEQYLRAEHIHVVDVVNIIIQYADCSIQGATAKMEENDTICRNC